MSVGCPPGGGQEGARAYGAEFVGAADRAFRRGRGVARNDGCPFGANSGSGLVAQARGRRQRAPSRNRMRRTGLRPTLLPRSRAAARSASRGQGASRAGSAATQRPSAGVSSRPGGCVAPRPTMLLRSASVSRGLRPGPGRSPSPSSPAAGKRPSRSRTVWGWPCRSRAIAGLRSPSQLRVISRARRIQAPGAGRLLASFRTGRSSWSSGGRARSSFGRAGSSPPALRHDSFPL